MIDSILKTQYLEIEEILHELHSSLDALKCVQARVYVIPRVSAQETYAPIKEIIPETVDDFLAQVKGKRMFSDFYGDTQVSTKCPIKMPGLLQYQGDMNEINPLVIALNRAKDAFKESVVSIGDADEQFRIVHLLYPYLIIEQLTRHVNIAQKGIRSVGFSFANKQLSDKISREAAEKLLKKSYFTPRDLIDPKVWHDLVDQAVAKVENLPSHLRLVKRREGKVQPIININYPFGWRQKAGSLPLIYVSEDDSKIKINDLKPYFAQNKEKNKRPAKQGKSVVIDQWLRIYAVPLPPQNGSVV